MKPLLTFLALFFCISITRAQETEVTTLPATVTDLFDLLYPDAKNISWQIIKGEYKSTFSNNKMSTEVLIDAEGNLVQSRTEIRTIALPIPATDYLEEHFAEKKIQKAMIVQNDEGIITFTATVDKSDLTFDATGQLLDTHSIATSAREK